MKPIILSAFFLISSSISSFADCPYKFPQDVFDSSYLKGYFSANFKEIKEEMILPLTGKYSGRTVQSVGIDPVNCRIIPSISIKRKPEVIGIWSMTPNGKELGKFSMSKHFGHPQNLTVEYARSGNPYMWLPDNDGLGAKRFKIVNDKDDKLRIKNVQFIKMLNEPVGSHSIAISADMKYIAIMGKISDKFPKKQAIKIYYLKDTVNNDDLTTINPVAEFALHKDQQASSNFRQGLAMIGDTVFVLTGNPDIKKTNRIISYSINGRVMQNEILSATIADSRATGSGVVDEPEGLNITTVNNQLMLLIGIASGDAGKKTNRIYQVPLNHSLFYKLIQKGKN